MANAGLGNRSYLVTHLQRHQKTAWTADPAEEIQLLPPSRGRGVADHRHPGTLPHGLTQADACLRMEVLLSGDRSVACAARPASIWLRASGHHDAARVWVSIGIRAQAKGGP